MNKFFGNKTTLAVMMVMVGLLAGYFLRIFVANSATVTQEFFPTSCKVDNQTYKSGDSVPSGDNCNSCGCTDGEITCTTMACDNSMPPQEPISGTDAQTCTYEGSTYANNAEYPSIDGCNTCHCLNGQTACTKMYCDPNTMPGSSL